MLRESEAAQAQLTAARAGILAAFCGQGTYLDDGSRAAGPWLCWQARVTRGAASGALGWMYRLAAHPRVAAALAAGVISESWARQLCQWNDRLAEEDRDDADQSLLAAAATGLGLADLAGLAEEIRARRARPDTDGRDDGYRDRAVALNLHYRGAGHLAGNLTPECAAALTAVLDSLGKRHGAEDDRTTAQRRHDALEEACRRLVAAGGLPEVAGQSVQILLHTTLSQLRSQPGAADAEAAWAAGRAAADGAGGWLSSRAAEGYACDAQLIPIVSGHLDPAALAAMTAAYLAGGQARAPFGGQPAGPAASSGGGHDGARGGGPVPVPLSARSARRLQDTLLRYAADVLSGPAGLAAFLRAGHAGPGVRASVSLPLDVGAAVSTIPAWLRRAIIARDRHCTFAGCRQPPSACQVHHYIPRSRGGTTSMTNCGLVCTFHHLYVIHRLGWNLTLNADGTTTATSPDGQRILHSHGPPTSQDPPGQDPPAAAA